MLLFFFLRQSSSTSSTFPCSCFFLLLPSFLLPPPPFFPSAMKRVTSNLKKSEKNYLSKEFFSNYGAAHTSRLMRKKGAEGERDGGFQRRRLPRRNSPPLSSPSAPSFFSSLARGIYAAPPPCRLKGKAERR